MSEIERWMLEVCPVCATPFGQGHGGRCPGGPYAYDRIEVVRADTHLGAVSVLRELAQMPLTATGKDYDRLVKAARALLPEYADITPTGGQ